MTNDPMMIRNQTIKRIAIATPNPALLVVPTTPQIRAIGRDSLEADVSTAGESHMRLGNNGHARYREGAAVRHEWGSCS
jgi:hypothetical protein